jgi:tetratricopeptide (TPR) repeat protein
MMLLPSAVRVSSALVYSRIGNGVPEILRANNGVWSPDLHQQLLNLHRGNPQDRDLLQAVSLVEKRMGKFSEAEQHLRQWIKLEPKASAAFNNLGNVYLATNKVDQAVEAYQRAIQLEATRTESYYNLGQAYLLNLLLNEAESEFRRAKELRPQLISFYTSIASRNPNRMAIDRTLDSVHLWRRIVEVTPETEALSEGFWSFLGAFYDLPAEEVLGGAFLVLLGWVHWGRRRIPLIRRCERCGRLICSRCSRSRVIGSQCVQCLNAFSKSPSGDPGLMKTKRIEVARYQIRKLALSRWLSFIFPGTGHLHRGHPKEGFLYIFIGAYFLMKALCWNGWVPNSMDLGISSSLPWVAAILFLFLIFYGWVQFRMTQILRREAKFYFRPAE